MVRVAYDDQAVYVGARMYDSDPKAIVARLGRRDAELNSDAFTFYVDPYHDRHSGFFFTLTAAGTFSDGVLNNDNWRDNSWDGVWEGKVKIDDQGWTAEMRIPYSQLRFQRKEERLVWGVNFQRTVSRRNEEDYLVFTPKNGSGFVSRFVDLAGIENIKPPRRLEILPYVTAKAEFAQHQPGDPFNDGSKLSSAVGSDFKLGFGSNLTLDATVNPDFGQVEVDPAVVNLTDVETFFEEKRPFFIEGSSIFQFGHGGASSFWGFNWGDPDFFYTRRIGRALQGNLPAADFVDMPTGQPLISAGDYHDFKELARPKSYLFNHYGQGVSTFSETTFVADPDGPGPAEPIQLPNPNFNFKSLRANAVWRWEYRPGSTFYAVWTQSRSDTESDGAFRLSHSLGRLWDTKGDNIFLVKLTFWENR